MRPVGKVTLTKQVVDEVRCFLSSFAYDRGYLGVGVCAENVWEGGPEGLPKLVDEYCEGLVVARAYVLCMQAKAGRFATHTDTDFGLAEGQLIRLHFPILTHEKATLSCYSGEEWTTSHLEPGFVYYFDPQIPHHITNESDVDRIHLVVDVEANPATRSLVTRNECV